MEMLDISDTEVETFDVFILHIKTKTSLFLTPTQTVLQMFIQPNLAEMKTKTVGMAAKLLLVGSHMQLKYKML